MRPVRFTCPLLDADPVTVEAYTTATPGLVIHEPIGRCFIHDSTPCWRVTHFRTGLCFPWCWESPEAAGAFAERASKVGSWQITGAPLRRRINLPYVRRYLAARAAELGAACPPGPAGDLDAVDNGVTA